MCRFADLNFEAQSRTLQEKYLATYERRRTKLQEQIDDLKAQEEARALAESRELVAESIPEELPEEPEATPDTEIPAPPARAADYPGRSGVRSERDGRIAGRLIQVKPTEQSNDCSVFHFQSVFNPIQP